MVNDTGRFSSQPSLVRRIPTGSRRMSDPCNVGFVLPIQPIAATHSSNFSAGEKYFNVFLAKAGIVGFEANL